MPWIKEGKSERYEWPPKPQAGGSHAVMAWIQRAAVDYYRLSDVCCFKVCKRAGACSTPDIACYKATEDWFRVHFWPQFRTLLRERAGQAAPPPYDGFEQQRRIAAREMDDWAKEAPARVRKDNETARERRQQRQPPVDRGKTVSLASSLPPSGRETE